MGSPHAAASMLGPRCVRVVSETSPFGLNPLAANSRRNRDDSLTTSNECRPNLPAYHFDMRAPMVLNPESKYPNRHAYVLKLRSDASHDEFVGRIENLVTGQQREFASVQDLVAFVAGDLVLAADERAARDADD